MWSLVTIIVCVVVIVAYAIYKLSRENVEAQTFAEIPTHADVMTNSPVVPATNETKDSLLYHLMRNVLQDEHVGQDNEKHGPFHPDQMIPVSTIVGGVEQFKANYCGRNREQILSIVDDSVRELKSRFGEEVSLRDLREFIASQRQRLSGLQG
jgi:hypothetical protein